MEEETKNKPKKFFQKTGINLFQGFFGIVINKRKRSLVISHRSTEKPSRPPFRKGRGSADDNFSKGKSFPSKVSSFNSSADKFFKRDNQPKTSIANLPPFLKGESKRILNAKNHNLKINSQQKNPPSFGKEDTRHKIPASALLWRGSQDTNKLKIKKLKLKTKKLSAFYRLRFLISNLRFVCLPRQSEAKAGFLPASPKLVKGGRPCILYLNKIFKKFIKLCFSTKTRAVISSFLIIALLSSTFFFSKNPFQSKADYTNNVNQTDWSGGADTGATVTPGTADGWNQYYEKGDNITADASGISVDTTGTATIDFDTAGNYFQEDDTKTEVEGGVGKFVDPILPDFNCGTHTVDYGGQTYGTVEINGQCWFTENLNIGSRINATTDQTDNSTIEKYCYSNTESNCTTYGGLYQWNEAMQYSTAEGVQGICPNNWHIATDSEWHTLENYYATGNCDSTRVEAYGCDPAGTALKEGGSSGFNALYNGILWSTSSSNYQGTTSYNWTSSYFDESTALNRRIVSTLSTVRRGDNNKLDAMGVRCIQNSGLTSYPTTPYYLTTSDTSQKDTSSWAEISGISLTQTTPTNTDLKYLVSFDGRANWKYWDGTAWQSSILADFQTYGNSKTTLEGLTSTDWEATGGFMAGTTTTLDFAIDLSSSDGVSTPELDQIAINYVSYTLQETIDFTTDGNYIHEDDTKTEVTGGVGKLKYDAYISNYPPAHNDTYVKATSIYSTSYYPHLATDPALLLTGGRSLNSWLTPSGATTNQRFHMDLGEAKNINRIYYENGHNSGAETGTGVQNFTFWGSNDSASFNNTTYSSDTGWTEITGLSQTYFDQHVASDTADPKYITINGNESSYRYYALKIADNWGGLLPWVASY